MDLENPKWMYLKFALFILIGGMCFAVVLIEHPSLKAAACMVILAWASARAYYFAFYVIEKYIDREYKFSGLMSFFRYLIMERRRGTGSTDMNAAGDALGTSSKMTDRPRLPIGFQGAELRAVMAMVFDPPGEGCLPTAEAYTLRLESGEVTIRALTETSELEIRAGSAQIPRESEFEGCYRLEEVSGREPFRRFLGKPLHQWWSIKNDAGYDDGFLIAFDAYAGLCFIAMNDVVSVLLVEGDLMA